MGGRDDPVRRAAGGLGAHRVFGTMPPRTAELGKRRMGGTEAEAEAVPVQERARIVLRSEIPRVFSSTRPPCAGQADGKRWWMDAAGTGGAGVVVEDLGGAGSECGGGGWGGGEKKGRG